MKVSTKLRKIEKFIEKHKFVKIKGFNGKYAIHLECKKQEFIKIEDELYISTIRYAPDKKSHNRKIYIPLDLKIKIPEKNEIFIQKDILTYEILFYFWLNKDDLYYFTTSIEALFDDFIKKETIIDFIKSLSDAPDTITSNYYDTDI